MDEISQEARNMLADAYMKVNKPWFAYEIKWNKGKQFDVPLAVITEALAKQPLYCKYDIPAAHNMTDEMCDCKWCTNS